MPMYYLERLLDLNDIRQKHLLRHSAVFCLFWLATVIFYRLLYRQFEHRGWAIFGVLLLILSPRIFAHAFFNTKDSVFLSFSIFSLATLLYFLDRINIRRMLLHALMSGMAIGIRNVGILIPLLSIAFTILYAIFCFDKRSWRYVFGLLLPGYFVATSLFVVVFWPFLWPDPLTHFIEAYRVMGNYQWSGVVLLFGNFYSAKELPWFYIPAWFVITVPVIYSVLFLVAFLTDGLSLIYRSVKLDLGWMRNRENRLVALSLSFFLLPILVVISNGSTLYDGWRQLFFIYPPFLIVCVTGARKVESLLKYYLNNCYVTLFRFSITICLLWIGKVMISFHPHQQVYFNVFAGDDRFSKYELDYWGASYQQGLKALLEKQDGKCVKLLFANVPGQANVRFLPEHLRNKVCTGHVSRDNYDFYLTNFRSFGARKSFFDGANTLSEAHILIEVDGMPILGVFKAKPR